RGCEKRTVLTNPSRANNRTGITLARFIPMEPWKRNSSAVVDRKRGSFPDETGLQKCCHKQCRLENGIHVQLYKLPFRDHHNGNGMSARSRNVAFQGFLETDDTLCREYPSSPCAESFRFVAFSLDQSGLYP